MPKGELSNQYLEVDPAKYTDFQDLPIIETGCDSYASWDPRFKHLTKDYTVDELVDALLAVIPDTVKNNKWPSPVHLVITGGEPLLKAQQKKYQELFDHPRLDGLFYVTFETNATQPLISEVRWGSEDREYHFSCSPKLSHSGEDQNVSINPEAVGTYLEAGHVSLKFVVSGPDDIPEIKSAMEKYSKVADALFEEIMGQGFILLDGVPARGIFDAVYLMPVGGTQEEYEANMKMVAELCLKEGFSFSPRLHCSIWGNQWST